MYGKGWRYIAIGGLFEIVWVIAMKYSNGFTDVFWSVASVIFIALSMLMLSKALDAGLPMGTAYAVWVGIGAVGVFAYGIMFMGDPSDILRILFVAMIVAGIAGLQRTSERTSDQ
ncbi:MAG: multidrug efflux SMR transporter [Methanomassiliicoccaceae archaeon]|nr:multidrug efflux SMR transporter [Methanomassiliicoccaceae archaeon]